MMQMQLGDDHAQGVLCEKGLMKEKYCNIANDLVRSFTPQGLNQVKEILGDPFYRKKFVAMLAHEVRDLPKEYQMGVVLELRLMLL